MRLVEHLLTMEAVTIGSRGDFAPNVPENVFKNEGYSPTFLWTNWVAYKSFITVVHMVRKSIADTNANFRIYNARNLRYVEYRLR